MVGLALLLVGGLGAGNADALALGGPINSKAEGGAAGGARGRIAREVNAKLLAEGRKNQCSFKVDSDVLAPGCDRKLKNLAQALVAAEKKLAAVGVTVFKFEVSGHTDSSGKPEFDRELSDRRAATIARELVGLGIPPAEIMSVGMAANRPLVTPEDTPAKKAKNRRYEIQVRF
jgi:outer membrane protein OmpA-like peptidoglycan-associated protein